MNASEPIILFDGVCNLCNRSVQFIIKRDRQKRFRFAALQGKSGQALLEKFGLQADAINSFIMIEGERAYTRSTAALHMFKKLGGIWSLLYGLMIIPKFIRDSVYNWIARNRYKWYGRREVCMIPSVELKDRFLD